MMRSTNYVARLLGFESQPFFYSRVTLVNYLITLCFSFLICYIEII